MFSDAVKVIRNSKIQGKGAVARRPIHAGELIFKIDSNITLVRLHEILSWPQNERKEFLTFAIQVGKYEYLFREGNIEYLNHSCEPNAWWEGYGTLVAHRDIDAGEEVTYDYVTTNIQLNYEMKCTCGSPTCRGVFSNNDYLRTDFQNRFGNHLPQHVLNAIQEAADPSQKKIRGTQLPTDVIEALKQAELDEDTLRKKYGNQLPEHVIEKIKSIIARN